MTVIGKKGEVWLIEHSRKGRLLVEVLGDPAQEFVTVKILSGKVKYLSMGAGTEGDTIMVRTSHVRWIREEKVPS